MDTAKAFKILYHIQGVLDLHEFWAREKLVPAKFVLVKLFALTYPIVAHKKPYLIIEHAGILMKKNKRT